ncbi:MULTISPECIES: hypothetical protein [Nostocales]|uniref:Uncharacterized protein n=3 Tax=Nostocales TaxID=1161 RepID=A0A0C1QVV8_9CYAN|nr:hypothetical protein [Tolypothrix bouteillei]KAF3884417.1 hypothetical protein DA73_0400002205 [Tolypothrix bouteillei VB521301]
MRVWLACFLVLFALAEFFDWIKEFQLPLPIYILGGAFLAVASNYDKLFESYFSCAIGEATLEQTPQAHLDSSLEYPYSISPNSPALQNSQQHEIEN